MLALKLTSALARRIGRGKASNTIDKAPAPLLAVEPDSDYPSHPPSPSRPRLLSPPSLSSLTSSIISSVRSTSTASSGSSVFSTDSDGCDDSDAKSTTTNKSDTSSRRKWRPKFRRNLSHDHNGSAADSVATSTSTTSSTSTSSKSSGGRCKNLCLKLFNRNRTTEPALDPETNVDAAPEADYSISGTLAPCHEAWTHFAAGYSVLRTKGNWATYALATLFSLALLAALAHGVLCILWLVVRALDLGVLTLVRGACWWWLFGPPALDGTFGAKTVRRAKHELYGKKIRTAKRLWRIRCAKVNTKRRYHCARDAFKGVWAHVKDTVCPTRPYTITRGLAGPGGWVADDEVPNWAEADVYNTTISITAILASPALLQQPMFARPLPRRSTANVASPAGSASKFSFSFRSLYPFARDEVDPWGDIKSAKKVAKAEARRLRKLRRRERNERLKAQVARFLPLP